MSLGCDWGMAVNPDTGNAGGIRIRLDRVHIKDAWVIDQAGIVSCVRTSFSPWILGAIYANTSATRRKDLWSRLTEALTSNLPCCLVGDFNQILSRAQRRHFSDFLNNNALSHLNSCGNRFTWCNGPPGRGNIFKRLDIGLANQRWKPIFPEANWNHLPRLSSDHNPLLIQCHPTTKSSSSHFRFDLVMYSGFLGHCPWCDRKEMEALFLSSCLQKVRRALKTWNRDYVKANVVHMDKLEQIIRNLQCKEESGSGLNNNEKEEQTY